MKISKLLLILLIIFLPIQLGFHFWPSWSYVFGLRIDYLSPTVYLTDILVILILSFWGLENPRRLTINNLQLKTKSHWLLFSVFFFLLLNCFFAQNQGVAFFKFLKIIEFTLLGFYISKNKINLSSVVYPLSIALIWSSIIAIAQFLKQSSLGGIFWWLGERTFNLSTLGIAKGVWQGKFFLRPYSTFSHPNSLAGFVFCSIILLTIGNQQSAMSKFIKWIAIGLGAIVILLTFSQAVLGVGLLLGLIYFLSRFWKKLVTYYLLFFLFLISHCSFLIAHFFKTSKVDESILLRFQLNLIAIKLFKQFPFIGVGLNNFIPVMAALGENFSQVYFLQPVHNIFLLILAETGIIGFLIFLFLIIKTFKKLLEIRNSLVIALLAILLTGMFDHYWLTLQQNQILMVLTFGLIFGQLKGNFSQKEKLSL